MKTFLRAVGLFFAIGVAVPAVAETEKPPGHCDRLQSVIEAGIQGLVAGDHSIRVRVALAAHERLGCDPLALLDTLKIRRPKITVPDAKKRVIKP